MTDPTPTLSPEDRATIRRGYLGRPLASAANDAMRLLDALDTAEAEIERLLAKVEWQAHWIASLDASRRAVLEHLPTRPDRETVRLAQHQALMPQAMSLFDALGGTQAAYEALLDTLADAVLTAWPGESRATVQAEALRDAAAAAVAQDNTQGDWWDDDAGQYCTPAEWLDARADRIEGENRG